MAEAPDLAAARRYRSERHVVCADDESRTRAEPAREPAFASVPAFAVFHCHSRLDKENPAWSRGFFPLLPWSRRPDSNGNPFITANPGCQQQRSRGVARAGAKRLSNPHHCSLERSLFANAGLPSWFIWHQISALPAAGEEPFAPQVVRAATATPRRRAGQAEVGKCPNETLSPARRRVRRVRGVRRRGRRHAAPDFAAATSSPHSVQMGTNSMDPRDQNLHSSRNVVIFKRPVTTAHPRRVTRCDDLVSWPCITRASRPHPERLSCPRIRLKPSR